ncbi:MAG: hypothetical protein JSR38_13635 [Proteobacteria bacterium]|nr:hypothetical protein [Pseudomonadota bacterium]
MTPTPSKPAPIEAGRNRLQVEVSDPVLLLLNHVADVLGLKQAEVVRQALLQALPGLVDQADQVRKRSKELAQATQGKR